MKHGIAKPNARVYLAVDMNRELTIKLDGEEFTAELENVEDGRRLRRFIQDQ